MARMFECCPSRYAWNLEKCEEEILIAGYDEILRFVSADQTWKAEFEYHFFDRGNGLAFESLDAINGVRRRRGLDEIVIRETMIYDYARSTDRPLRAHHRRELREDLKSASADVRHHRLGHAKAESERLPLPRTTFEEWKERQQDDARSGLTYQEIANRLAVQKSVRAFPPPSRPTLQPDLAARMLTLASPSIWGEIIPKLSAEGALEVAEKIADVELRDALVKQSLSAAYSLNAA
jgi:hypothetical protein